jgi:hypothetical protein
MWPSICVCRVITLLLVWIAFLQQWRLPLVPQLHVMFLWLSCWHHGRYWAAENTFGTSLLQRAHFSSLTVYGRKTPCCEIDLHPMLKRLCALVLLAVCTYWHGFVGECHIPTYLKTLTWPVYFDQYAASPYSFSFHGNGSASCFIVA